jgi:hypothetical protein
MENEKMANADSDFSVYFVIELVNISFCGCHDNLAILEQLLEL